MKVTSRPVLGVAFDERSAAVAEVRLARGDWRVERAAEFPFPEGVSWQEPAALGKALGRFLHERHFKAKRAVLGFPANWMMAREVTVPPATAETTTEIVRLQAEREFSPEPSELALDYTDTGDLAQARPVLVVGALRERVNQVAVLAAAARLTVLSVTSEALAVSAAFQGAPSASGITVLLRSHGADLVTRAGSQFCAIRRVPAAVLGPLDATAPADRRLAPLLSEVRRALASLAGSRTSAQETELTLWDGVGLSPDSVADMTAQLGLEVRVKNKLTKVAGRAVQAGGESASTRFVPATALGIAGANGAQPPIDLAHSRFAPPARKILGRRMIWASAAAVIVLAAIAALGVAWRNEEAEVSRLAQQIANNKKDVDAAEELVIKATFARGWYEDRPKVLACLRAMTAAFPSDNRAWVTRITFKGPAPATRSPGAGQAATTPPRAAKPGVAAKPGAGAKPGVVQGPAQHKASLTGVIIGKCADDRAALDTLDRLKNVKGFFDVNMPQSTGAGPRGRENSFSLNFSYYTPAE